jgi:hypothetical protein
MSLRLWTTDGGPRSNWARLWTGTHQALGSSESTSSTARDARERFHSCHRAMPVSLNGALAGILFFSSAQPKLFNVYTDNHGRDFGIGSILPLPLHAEQRVSI